MAIEKDPVCGMDVEADLHTGLHVEHEGKVYWFCGRGCMLDFSEEPEKYLQPDYQPHM